MKSAVAKVSVAAGSVVSAVSSAIGTRQATLQEGSVFVPNVRNPTAAVQIASSLESKGLTASQAAAAVPGIIGSVRGTSSSPTSSSTPTSTVPAVPSILPGAALVTGLAAGRAALAAPAALAGAAQNLVKSAAVGGGVMPFNPLALATGIAGGFIGGELSERFGGNGKKGSIVGGQVTASGGGIVQIKTPSGNIVTIKRKARRRYAPRHRPSQMDKLMQLAVVNSLCRK